MIRQWYLVQVYLHASIKLDTEHKLIGMYYCDILSKNRSDVGTSDSMSQWWPDWYQYSHDSNQK